MEDIAASIIIPVYNGEKFLRRCLDSLVNQTYRDFEIVIINDGSTDASPAICDAYAAKDDRIHVYHQENQGVAAARQAGLSHARGQYIFWVDADDYVSPLLLEKALSLLGDPDVIVWNSETIIRGNQVTSITHWKNQPVENWRRDVAKGSFSILWTSCGKKTLWDSISFPAAVTHAGEDGFLMLELVQKAETIAVIPDILYYHIDDVQGSLSNTKGAVYYYDNFQLWKYRYDICRKEYPDLTGHCGQRALAAAVKAYCLDRRTNRLTREEQQQILDYLTFLVKHPVPGRTKEKLLSWAIRNHHGWICDLYVRHKLK